VIEFSGLFRGEGEIDLTAAALNRTILSDKFFCSFQTRSALWTHAKGLKRIQSRLGASITGGFEIAAF
jgi:hypothetical protein